MKRAKASEELVLDIRRTILSGKYPPGSQLPSERELAKKYNLSRVPVREAIEQLVNEKILRTEPHVGTFVTDLYDVKLLSRNMYQTSHIEKKILKESLFTRQLIESEGAALAAEKATEDDVKQIQEHLFTSTDEFRKLKQMKQNTFFKADLAFHLSIVNASHSDTFIQYLSNLTETITIHQFCSMQMEDSFNAVPDSHFRIYNAILSKDPQRARQEMHQHLQRTSDLIL
ncbi:MAG: FadR family transcriptional regulator [Lachnospiraceae bacterium]